MAPGPGGTLAKEWLYEDGRGARAARARRSSAGNRSRMPGRQLRPVNKKSPAEARLKAHVEGAS